MCQVFPLCPVKLLRIITSLSCIHPCTTYIYIYIHIYTHTDKHPTQRETVLAKLCGGGVACRRRRSFSPRRARRFRCERRRRGCRTRHACATRAGAVAPSTHVHKFVERKSPSSPPSPFCTILRVQYHPRECV